MRARSPASILTTATLAFAAVASAQTNVDPTNIFSWSESCGWMNWRDADSPVGAQGALIAGPFLSGITWCENIGYINLGDGTPASSSSYANITGADFGVNIRADHRLSGLAWGENIGWVNLDDSNHFVSTACPADYNRAHSENSPFR